MNKMQGYGIPRLQELGFLLRAGQDAAHGKTFDSIRRGLIDMMSKRAVENTPSGNDARHQLAEDKPGAYVDNASGALAELMRLGLLEKAPLPTSPKAAEAYRKTQFLLTDDGVTWAEMLEEESNRAALDFLLVRLWSAHPQLATYIRLLAQKELFFVPMLGWSSAHPDGAGPEGRDSYVLALAELALRTIRSRDIGWAASREEILQAISAYSSRREAFAARRGKPAYKRSRDFVRDCDEALTVLALRKSGVVVDYISLEIIRRWTQDLLVANFSYYVPTGDASGFRAWSTADLREDDGVPTFDRRPPSPDRSALVENLLPKAFDIVRRQEGEGSFVAIWKVRAFVCSNLRVNDTVFDRALREFQERARHGELPFQLALEVATGGSIPPTERPFRGVPDRFGQAPLFTLINVAQQRERIA